MVAPNWIGDLLMAQPLLAHLREQGAVVDVLAPEWVAPVARRMPEVSEVIAAPFRHGPLQFGERRRLGRSLRGRYERAIVLPNTWKSALVPFFAGIPERIGYVGEARYGLLNRLHKSTKAPMREHYAALGDGKVASASLRGDAEKARSKFNLPPRYAAFCPGAEYGPAKRWPYFAELAEKIGMPVVIVGSPKDLEVSNDIPGTNLAGKTTLEEAIDILAGAAVVVSNDSGLMHVAAALGRPLVALFGSSSPEHTPPQAGRVLWLRVECSPCFARECPLGHFRCMREMSAETVLAEVKSIL